MSSGVLMKITRIVDSGYTPIIVVFCSNQLSVQCFGKIVSERIGSVVTGIEVAEIGSKLCILVLSIDELRYFWYSDNKFISQGLVSYKKSRWTAACWLPSSHQFILCCDDGIVFTDQVHDNNNTILISKQKISVISEIGPHNKLFLANNKSTIESLKCVHINCTAVIIFSSNPITNGLSLTWATVDTAANSLTIHWSIQTNLSALNLPIASRSTPSNNHGVTLTSQGAPIVWTCMCVDSELWVLSTEGIIGKVSLTQYWPISGILLTHEETSLPESGIASIPATTIVIVLSCSSGIMLRLALIMRDGTFQATSISEIVYCSAYHFLPPNKPNQCNTVFPSYQLMTLLSPEAYECGQGSDIGTNLLVKGVPGVLLGYHSVFGVEVIRLSGLILDDHQDRKLRIMAKELNRINEVARIIPMNEVQIKGREDVPSGTSILLGVCPVLQQSALYRAAPPLCSAELISTGLVGVEVPADQLASVNIISEEGAIMMTSRSPGAEQSSLYQLNMTMENDQNSTEVQLLRSPVEYEEDVFTVGFYHSVVGFIQFTPRDMIITGDLEGTREKKKIQLNVLVSQSFSDTSISKLYLEKNGVALPWKLSNKRTHDICLISFTAQLSSTLFAIANINVIYIIHVSSDASVKVCQLIEISSEVCALAEVQGTAPLLCVSTWDGAVFVFTGSSTEVVVRCIHALQGSGDEGGGGERINSRPVRNLSVSCLFNSPELKVYGLITSQDCTVCVRHIVHKVSENTTNTSIAKNIKLPNEVLNFIDLSIQVDEHELTGKVCVYIRTITQDYALMCTISLLDGCTRQVPFMEWNCNPFVHPIGHFLHPDAVLFPLKQHATSSLSSSLSPPVWSNTSPIYSMGWLNINRDSSSCDLSFGHLSASAKKLNIAARTICPGLAVSVGYTADNEHILVLCDTNQKSRKHCMIGGHRALTSAGSLMVYNAHSLACAWQGQVPGFNHMGGYLVGALAGPKPGVSNICMNPSSRGCFYSLVYANPPDNSNQVSSRTAAASVMIATYHITPVVEGNYTASYPISVGEVLITPHKVEMSAQTPAEEAAGEMLPIQSASFHFKVLNINTHVLCMTDNVLRLIGWRDEVIDSRNSFRLTELSTTRIEAKAVVILDMQTSVGSGNVVLSLAFAGFEVYSHVINKDVPVLQLTYSVARPSALWTSLECHVTIDAAEDKILDIFAHDRLKSQHQRVRVWLPGLAASLTGEARRHELSDIDSPMNAMLLS